MEEIILIEKYSPIFKWWKNMDKFNQVGGLSAEEVVNRYQGFEGSLVLYFPNDENSDTLLDFFNKCKEFQKLSSCLLLHLFSQRDAPYSLGTEATKVGYDVGFIYCEAGTVYSSIFNEVIFGFQKELVEYKNTLNEHFLFGDRSIAEQYVVLHNEMEAKGFDVEHDPMIIYEIWRHKNL